MAVPTMMLDHPSWSVTSGGEARRAFRSGGGVWCVTHTPGGSGVDASVRVTRTSGDVGSEPQLDVIDPAGIDGSPAIRDRLRAAGTVMRVRNPDVWEALATAIIRQVIRAQQARILHRRFCDRFGEPVTTAPGPLMLFPGAEVVLGLSDDDFAALGMTFFRRGLRAAAQAFLDRGDTWPALAGHDLVTELRRVPRVGPWTAGAAVADVTNDFSLYPFSDLAVRTWARRMAPSIVWPNSEREFGRMWRAMSGDQLSAWTLLTLAWGADHARSAY